MTSHRANPRWRTRVVVCEQGRLRARADDLAVERALEIQVAGLRPLIAMCTPGHDHERVAGFMHSEGVVRTRDDIVYLKHAAGQADVMRLMLKPQARERLARLERGTAVSSACGV